MILLSDANVLMDLGYVGGLPILPGLGVTEVLSTVLLECSHATQPDLVQQIQDAGILTVEVTQTLLEEADDYAAVDELLSLQDRQCLLYARQQQRVLLTGDRRLREAAGRESVRCHGSLWLVEEAHRQTLFSATELCRWLNHWPLRNRRFPAAELQRLRKLLNCQE